MKYINTAHAVADLITILAQLPLDATITINSSGGYSSSLEIWYDEDNNDIEIK